MTQEVPGRKRNGPQSNAIPLPFDKAVEGLLAVKPRKAEKPKKKPDKK